MSRRYDGTGISRNSPAFRCFSGIVFRPSLDVCSNTRSTVPPSRKHDFCTASASSIRSPHPRISQTASPCRMPATAAS